VRALPFSSALVMLAPGLAVVVELVLRRPIVAVEPEAPAAQAFRAVAGKVAAQISIQNMRVLRVVQV